MTWLERCAAARERIARGVKGFNIEDYVAWQERHTCLVGESVVSHLGPWTVPWSYDHTDFYDAVHDELGDPLDIQREILMAMKRDDVAYVEEMLHRINDAALVVKRRMGGEK